MNLEKLIESHFAPKKGNDLIIQLIESKISEANERIYTSSPINIEVAKGGTLAYREFQSLLAGIRTSPWLSDRIKSVNDVLLNPRKIIKNASITKAFSSFFLIQELRDALINVEPKVAGFQAESIIAQLLDGTKIADMKAADVSSEIFGKFQVKTISSNKVGGSLNMALDLYEQIKGQAYKFIIIFKQSDSVFDFYIFGLSFIDFIQNINFPKNFTNAVKIKIGDRQKLDNLKIDVDYLFENYNIVEEQGIYYYFMPELQINIHTDAMNVMKQVRDRQDQISNVKDFIKKFAKTLEYGEIPTFETEFQIKTSYINDIYAEKDKYADYEKIPTNSKYAGTLDLSDEKINAAKERYNQNLVGDMLAVIKELNKSVDRMNQYFSTLDRETGNKTMASLDATQTTFSERFLSRKQQ